jgi:putative membrane protein
MTPGLLARAGVGGALMGLANLVPGISGGTMLVAAGVYTRFIDAIGDVTRLRLRVPTLLLLATIVVAAGIAIGGGAGLIKAGLESHRWAMYSLFIGLTLGGVPVMLRMARPMTNASWAGLAVGFIAMAALALAQTAGAQSGSGSTNPVMLGLAGVAGASAMILPGVSGAYLLLLLGQYDPIITAIKDFVSAAKDADLTNAATHFITLLPVGIGVVLGVLIVGNVLKFVLHRYEKATLGVLLGLLLAAPVGLYPFKHGVPPEVGDTIKGQVITAETLAGALDDPKDWTEKSFPPTPVQIGGALGIITAGFAITFGLSFMSRPKKTAQPAD